jgi:xanthine dehydrogenase large subunit
VGEPPLLLGLSAWLAARDAVRAARAGAEVDLALPATGERLLLAMEGVSP